MNARRNSAEDAAQGDVWQVEWRTQSVESGVHPPCSPVGMHVKYVGHAIGPSHVELSMCTGQDHTDAGLIRRFVRAKKLPSRKREQHNRWL